MMLDAVRNNQYYQDTALQWYYVGVKFING